MGRTPPPHPSLESSEARGTELAPVPCPHAVERRKESWEFSKLWANKPWTWEHGSGLWKKGMRGIQERG